MAELALDIGNTTLKWGVFEKGILSDSGKASSDFSSFPAVPEFVTHCVYCASGIVHRNLFEEKLKGVEIFEVRPGTFGPVTSEYTTPDTLGPDRIAGFTAANVIFPSENVLVIDAGTCITYDVVDKNGIHLGGSISPGLNMRLRAMNKFTKNLPLVSVPKVINPRAVSTLEAIGQGALAGAVFEIEGMIAELKKTVYPIKVLLTGGDAGLFANFLKTEIFAEPNLVLLGLYEILKYHAK
ncbi:MAG: type III pantothenate kinase [Saprospirales bacterium]|nr:MAG: type III pantothenate kinase [Saprospirales bacterium]